MKNNKKKIVIGVAIFAVIVAALVAVWCVFGPKGTEGAKEYTLVVVDDQGEKTTYEANTDQEFLRGALEELEESEDFTLEGSESEYGLFIEKVNDLEANYDKDGAYWSIYVNGEYGQYGLDTQPVTDGDEYTLAYEVYQAE